MRLNMLNCKTRIYVAGLYVPVSLIICLWVHHLESGIIGAGASVFKVKDMRIDR